ncbi:hypothetical protein EN866_32890 [Mesorhizobium sp. M2D.F.Ca.ET.223.01.1.1]|uniref:hypothetical protein n=1 Tax=Mesorhizobium sp. M2D.F.Ca.ET.223.01.1.1 TaxID=2563940 RepID=UPI00109315BE|nr:hypothetical protein [Mesorhizobium sp. M2D.F.Ca.ET.223.01.1.1]TGR84605.1 hypothetical protein EN866_32890 [Mesorhizobium sp. M2D.F.Ca.ET.223.01.1.1]TGT64510.1 hypothetical protein EN802_32495 [bacterium M00.F.Ca.ET.159.01.1.1]TGT79355.1 hypothetical protein EN800_31835 [bacterium M00.F.Ca.ET.157.01.1.1]
MPKNAVTDWSTTAANNTDVGGINIQGSAPVSNMDDALRTIMAQIATAMTTGSFEAHGVTTKSSNYTVLTTDRGYLINCTSALTLSLPAAATAAAGFTFSVKANGASVILDPNGAELIDGAATVTMQTGTSAVVVCTGTAWITAFIAEVTLAGTQTLTNKTLTTPTITINDNALTIQDNGDTTKKLALELSGITTATTRTMTLPDFSFIPAAINVQGQTVTGGASVTSFSLGTVSSGTLTPVPSDRPMQHYINNGAHTLAPGAVSGYYVLDITNGASAGAITTSGWTKVSGDAFTTTNGNKFRCSCSIGNGGSLLSVQALQ